MQEEAKKALVDSYISGKLNKQEREKVEHAFTTGELEPFLKSGLKDDWKQFSDEKADNLDHVLDKLHHMINTQEASKKRTLLHRSLHYYYRIAAVLLLPILFTSILFIALNMKQSNIPEEVASFTISSPAGARTAFNLPDGSSGFLNSGSSLSFQTPFTNNRQLVLSGEAWFDVAHDPENPLTVNAGNSSVCVLGTTFNLNAYPEEDFMELILETGIVEFKAHAESKPVRLNPEHKLLLNNSGIHIEKTDTEKYTGWTKGRLIFRGDSMLEVARRIGRWYNVDVKIESDELDSYTFVGTFQDDPLEEVLKLLAMTSPIQYKIIERERQPDGSWSRKQVLLSRIE